jgi:tetratricopeptide (TPR) repeat protein
LAFSSDGAWLAAAREDTTIDLWRTSEALEKSAAPPATLTGHTDAVTSVCFSPDGLRLASASADRTVKLWDVQSRQEVMSLPGAGLSGLHAKIAFTPDGAALVLIDQTAIDSWDVSAADASPEAQQQRLRQWHAAEMTQAAGGGHWFAAAQHGEQLSQLAPASAEYAAQHGIALARLGQWDEASAHLQEALNREPAAETCYHLALVQLRQGDEAGYGKTAAAYLAAHAQSESATVTNDMVWTCALSPAPIREHPEIVALAEKAAATLKSAASLNTLGGVYLRAGRPKDAIKQISEGIRRRGAGLPQDWILLCLAYAAQGDRDRAASELKRTKEWLAEQEARRTAHRPTDPMNTWHARLELEMLLREAEAAVNDQSEA